MNTTTRTNHTNTSCATVPNSSDSISLPFHPSSTSSFSSVSSSSCSSSSLVSSISSFTSSTSLHPEDLETTSLFLSKSTVLSPFSSFFSHRYSCNNYEEQTLLELDPIFNTPIPGSKLSSVKTHSVSTPCKLVHRPLFKRSRTSKTRSSLSRNSSSGNSIADSVFAFLQESSPCLRSSSFNESKPKPSFNATTTKSNLPSTLSSSSSASTKIHFESPSIFHRPYYSKPTIVSCLASPPPSSSPPLLPFLSSSSSCSSSLTSSTQASSFPPPSSSLSLPGSSVASITPYRLHTFPLLANSKEPHSIRRLSSFSTSTSTSTTTATTAVSSLSTTSSSDVNSTLSLDSPKLEAAISSSSSSSSSSSFYLPSLKGRVTCSPARRKRLRDKRKKKSQLQRRRCRCRWRLKSFTSSTSSSSTSTQTRSRLPPTRSFHFRIMNTTTTSSSFPSASFIPAPLPPDSSACTSICFNGVSNQEQNGFDGLASNKENSSPPFAFTSLDDAFLREGIRNQYSVDQLRNSLFPLKTNLELQWRIHALMPTMVWKLPKVKVILPSFSSSTACSKRKLSNVNDSINSYSSKSRDSSVSSSSSSSSSLSSFKSSTSLSSYEEPKFTAYYTNTDTGSVSFQRRKNGIARKGKH